MWSYFLRRVAIGIPTLWVIITVCFFLMRLTPGGPFDFDAPVPAEILANLRAQYHLDDPLWRQYLDYLWNLLRGDFGPSFKYRDFTVTTLIAQGFPVSLQNGLSALVLAIVVGVPLGIVAALAQNTRRDYIVSAAAMTGIVIPNFIMGHMLILIFGVWAKDSIFHLPAGGWENGALTHRILPVLCLALPYIAYLVRITRGSMIEAMRANYVRTARAKGLPFRLVVLRHALKSALMPVVTFLGPATAFLLTGSMVVETIFQIPGIGRYFVQGALNRDYTLVMGVTIISAALVIAMNLVVDMLYGLLDPKVRYDGR
ncbi:MAG: oligopeptide ABC transporter permease OppB [Rhodospirillaceae bacterium]|nr:oligopeptide ABC transporter permease OppB [Rhodospirillaceae bacterium]